jgi:hypothetical protein
MHDEKGIHTTFAEATEVVEGKNGFATEASGGVLSDDEDAQCTHDRPVPKRR